MEKKIAPKATKGIHLPGADHSQQLAIIYKVLDSLAHGEARKRPDFVH